MFLKLVVSSLAVGITAWLMKGVSVDPWWAAVVVAVVLGLINCTVRPIVKLFSLPLNLLTLGLFTFVINALMVMLCSYFLPAHFKVEGFFDALLFSVIQSVVVWFLNIFAKK
ncbi:MAG: phage holin family protein [Muribaculaceae bacterium]|nr:phage holin family protein [Muribaculaceae bacterium]